jgi:putative PIN family toxin of toxin-antitoxin system
LLVRECGIVYDTTVTPRVVLDTNVLVAALRSRRGAGYRLLSLVGTGVFEHSLSVGLLFEYEAALKRPGVGSRLPRRRVDEVLDYLAATARRHHIHYLWRPVLKDPGDDLVLEVAVAGGCQAVVTYNRRDFAGAEQFGIRVLTPAQFLAELETRP